MIKGFDKELQQIAEWNKAVEFKQHGRLALGGLCLILGGKMLYDYIFQKGITYDQEMLRSLYPEECEAITQNLLNTIRRESEN